MPKDWYPLAFEWWKYAGPMGDKSQQNGVLLDTAIAADQLAGVSRAARRVAERDNKKKSKGASGASQWQWPKLLMVRPVW